MEIYVEGGEDPDLGDAEATLAHNPTCHPKEEKNVQTHKCSSTGDSKKYQSGPRNRTRPKSKPTLCLLAP